MKIVLLAGAVFITAFFCSANAQNYLKQTADIKTDDGFIIAADIITLSEDYGPGILALHNHGRNRGDWEPLVKYLADGGISKALAIDIRGHGESILKNKADDSTTDTLNYSQFKRNDYLDIINDIVYAFDYLKSLEGVDSLKCGIIGARSGAVYAVKTAIKQSQTDFLILLSPQVIYRGVAINDDIKNVNDLPVLIIANENIEDDLNNGKWLYKNCSSEYKKKKIFNDSDFNPRSPESWPKLGDYIAVWLKKVLK